MTQQRLAIIRQHQIPVTGAVNSNLDDRMSGNDKSTSGSGGGVHASSPALTDYERPTTAGIETSGALDSELSICTDSMDSSSVQDVDDL